MKLNIEGKVVSLGYSEHFANLTRMNQSLNFGARDNYISRGLLYVDVPEIVGITGACENVDTLFKVGNRMGLPLFFSQTGQLALEQTLQSFPGVFTVIHSGRDEEIEDERHLRQFRLTEEEFDCTMAGMARETYDEEVMFEALLSHIQAAVQAMIARVVEDRGEELEQVYGREVKALKYATKNDFLRINYEDAVNLLRENGFKKLCFGDDLGSAEEARVVEILNKGKQLPVFIMRYPKEIKFFNMKVSEKDPRVVLSADLVFPFAGEGVGSAVREHDYERLNKRLLESTMYRLHIERGGKYGDFGWYLNIVKDKGSNPHAGYGIGNERVMQYILGETDIRRASMFSLLNRQTGDWDERHYGQAAVLQQPQLKILLSIGKKRNKRILLPEIKRLIGSERAIIYATQKTHEYLEMEGVRSLLVHKISQLDHTPNIADLLSRRVFDLIVNIPTRTKVRTSVEFTDGKLIRKGAVDLGIKLITDPEVAIMTLRNLARE